MPRVGNRDYEEVVCIVQVAQWQEALEMVFLERRFPESVPGILELELGYEPGYVELGAGNSHGSIRSADSCRRAVKTEDRDLALSPVASTK